MERECAELMSRISVSRLLPAITRECCNLARVPAPLSKSPHVFDTKACVPSHH